MDFAPWFGRELRKWFLATSRDLPWRAVKDPYAIWVSEIMLQQTQIAVVIPAYLRFMRSFPTVEVLAQAEVSAVREAVRGLGYYRRFGFLHLAAQKISSGELRWPRTFEEWLTIPGVGRYTAAAVSSIAYGEPVAVLDGNVERVLCRYFAEHEIPRTIKAKLQHYADALLNAHHAGDHNQAVMELGQRICTKGNPSCGICPVAQHCRAYAQGLASSLPTPKPKQQSKQVELALIVETDGYRVRLVERPPQAHFLAGIVGFPTSISLAGKLTGDGHHVDLSECRLIGAISHTITNHKIQAAVYVKRVPEVLSGELIGSLEPKLTANLDRKAWHLYLKKIGAPQREPLSGSFATKPKELRSLRQL